MKTFTDETAPETFRVECILSPIKGEQVFEDIEVPLTYGEQAVRAFFEGYATAKELVLAKVSMCVYNAPSQGLNLKLSSLK